MERRRRSGCCPPPTRRTALPTASPINIHTWTSWPVERWLARAMCLVAQTTGPCRTFSSAETTPTIGDPSGSLASWLTTVLVGCVAGNGRSRRRSGIPMLGELSRRRSRPERACTGRTVAARAQPRQAHQATTGRERSAGRRTPSGADRGCAATVRTLPSMVSVRARPRNDARDT